MRSTTSAAVDPSLFGCATSYAAARKLKFPINNLPAVKLAGKRLTVACAASASSPPLVRRREILYFATASFLMPLPCLASAIDETSLLQQEIGKVLSKGRAAGLLRLVFHDAGTFDKSDQTGGMNGSLVYELDRPENTGLAKSLKILQKAKSEVDAVRPVSWADLIAMGGAEAVSVCGGPKIPVQLGRIDATVPDPEGKLPEETLNAPAMKQVFDKKGFSAQELVALSGAHTLGNKGFGSPVVFDNSYYKVLLEKPWSAGGMSGMVGLPSDRALVEDDECLGWITKYADDQNLFFEDFKNVYIKLVNTGAKWHGPHESRIFEDLASMKMKVL